MTIVERSKAGRWVDISGLLHLYDGSTRGRDTVNNALRAAMKHGLLERTEDRPFQYRLRSDLDAEKSEFVEDVKRRWTHEFGGQSALDRVSPYRVRFDLRVFDYDITLDPDTRAAVVIDIAPKQEIADWLDEQLPGKWRIAPDALIFESAADQAIFELQWRQPKA